MEISRISSGDISVVISGIFGVISGISEISVLQLFQQNITENEI